MPRGRVDRSNCQQSYRGARRRGIPLRSDRLLVRAVPAQTHPPKVPKTDDRVDRGPDFQSECGHNKARHQLRIRHLLALAERIHAQSLILRGYVRWLRRLRPLLLPRIGPTSRFPDGVLGQAPRVCPPGSAGRWQRNQRTADPPRFPDQLVRTDFAADQRARRIPMNKSVLRRFETLSNSNLAPPP